jgi:hypothetical protein
MEVGPPGSPCRRRSQTTAVSCRSRAGVGSDCGHGSPRAGQVSDEKTNVREPLLTHRKFSRRHRNRGWSWLPGQTRSPSGGVLSQGAACSWPWRCPVYRWRELVAGAGREGENLSPRYRRSALLSRASRGRTPGGNHHKGQSTDARHRGGPARTSDEGAVMALERRGRAGQVVQRSTPRGMS